MVKYSKQLNRITSFGEFIMATKKPKSQEMINPLFLSNGRSVKDDFLLIL